MSGSEQSEKICIRATAKRNGMTSLFLGAVGLIAAALILVVLPSYLFLFGIFVTTTAIVALLVGWFKLREPAHSFEITKQAIFYYNRRGRWQLAWDNIQRIDIPRTHQGLEQRELDLVGIRVRDYGPLLKSISPRLITNLLMEQRPLLLQAENCPTGTCYSEAMFEADKYKLEDGTQLKGIPAMMANRMERLRTLFGYDLFISASELDRDKAEFVQLLRQCQNQIVVNQ